MNNYLCYFVIIALFYPISAHTDTLIITSGRTEPFVNATHTGFYDQLVQQMFKRINIDAQTVVLPSERSLINANTGIDDGNIARIKGIEKKYKNLVMVPEKIIDFEFVAFTKLTQAKVNNWKSLEPYNISYINGWKLFEKKAKYYKSLVKTKESDQLFTLLRENRADIVLYDLWSGLWWIKNNNSDIYYLKPPFAKVKLYLYLNKKHKALVPVLDKAIKDMKKDGSYQKIFDQTLNSLL